MFAGGVLLVLFAHREIERERENPVLF